MCGLAEFLVPGGRRAKDLRATAARMARTLEHRGPDDAMAAILRLPGHYDEPFADASQIPTFGDGAL